VGAATVRTLARSPDTRVIALARSRPAGDARQNVDWVECALEELTPSHWPFTASTAVDALVHLAAFTPKNAGERDRARDIIDTNVVGMRALLASLPSPPRRLVFCSTLDVYAPAAFDGVVDERSPIGPVGLYGLSKLFGEGLAESYARSAGIEHVTLRLGHVYGPGEERYAKLVPETIRRLLAGTPPRIAGDGRDTRDLLYVDDAAEALARSCVAPLGDSHTINIARGESYPIHDVVDTIATLIGYQGPVERVPRSTDAHSTVFDTSLMTQVLGSWTFVPLVDGLRQELAEFNATSPSSR
jgi:UDP-glucose 4-epimerase